MVNTRFEVVGWMKYAEEDIFEDGCQLNSTTTAFGDDRWSAPTVSNLVEQLRAFVPFTSDGDAMQLDACEELGRIDISGMETIDGNEPTVSQLEDWKRGEYRLWYVTYTFQVERVTRETIALDGVTA